jgi:hypothetical protein
MERKQVVFPAIERLFSHPTLQALNKLTKVTIPLSDFPDGTHYIEITPVFDKKKEEETKEGDVYDCSCDIRVDYVSSTFSNSIEKSSTIQWVEY